MPHTRQNHLTVSTRLDAVAGSATLAVDSKAKALRAAGQDVVGFGAGEPDFATPLHIVQAAQAACSNPAAQKYGPIAGIPELRSAIAAKTKRDSGLVVNPEQVVVTNGGKQAVFSALAAVLNDGDEVILPAPYWNTYEEATKLAGGRIAVVHTTPQTGFRATIDQLDSALTSRSKALVFVSPSNPTGAVYTREQVKAIAAWALEHDLWVITDEIYEHLVYDGSTFHSLPVELPELAERTIVVNGVAKTYAMTGWRVGWLIGPPQVANLVERFQSHVSSNVCGVAQRAALAAVCGPLDAVYEMRTAFARRRLAIHSALSAMPGVRCELGGGAFYAFPSFEGLMGKQLFGTTIDSTLELANVVLDRAKVAFVPGEAFGAPGFARFSYALSDDSLHKGMQRLHALLEAGLD